MKAYKLSSEQNEYNLIVYAPDATKARQLGLGSDPFNEVDYIDIRARRAPEADQWADEKDYPREETDGGRLRELGWWLEDASSCDCCGLYDWGDGQTPAWTVCYHCQQCGECGHTTDCPFALGPTLMPELWVDLDYDYLEKAGDVQFRHNQRSARPRSVPRAMVAADLTAAQRVQGEQEWVSCSTET